MTDSLTRMPLRRFVGILLAAALVLQGCGTGVGNFLSGMGSYDDPADPCNYARQPLIESRRAFSESILAGAAIGAAGGALAGAALSRDSGTGAGLGALAGGLAGAVGGYLAAKERQARTQGELIASIDRDAARDNTSLVSARNAVGTLTRCRRRQATEIDRAYRSRQISAAQARQELEKVRGQMRADNALITEVLGKVEERSTTYASAKEHASSRGRRVVRASAGSTGALQRTEQQVKQEQNQHQEVDSGLQRRISDLSAAVG